MYFTAYYEDNFASGKGIIILPIGVSLLQQSKMHRVTMHNCSLLLCTADNAMSKHIVHVEADQVNTNLNSGVCAINPNLSAQSSFNRAECVNGIATLAP